LNLWKGSPNFPGRCSYLSRYYPTPSATRTAPTVWRPAPFKDMFAPGTVWAYAKLLSRGSGYQFRKSDMLQMGGDFVLDKDGTVVYEFRGASPHQRPAALGLIEVLDGI